MNELAKMEEKDNSMKIIEVNGVKMEVDMRTAKVAKLELYKVGSNVRILQKEYNDNFKTYAGVIIGFDQFKKRPSILIAYLKPSYSDCDIEFLAFNKDTKDVEICPADDTFVPFQKSTIIEQLNRKVLQAENSLNEEKAKREYFTKYFDKYFDKE